MSDASLVAQTAATLLAQAQSFNYQNMLLEACQDRATYEIERIRRELEERDTANTLVYFAQPIVVFGKRKPTDVNQRLTQVGNWIATQLEDREGWRIVYLNNQNARLQQWFVESDPGDPTATAEWTREIHPTEQIPEQNQKTITNGSIAVNSTNPDL